MANGGEIFGAGLRGLTEALLANELRREKRARSAFDALQTAGATPTPVRGRDLRRLREEQGLLGRIFGTGLPTGAVEVGGNVFEFQEPPTLADLSEFAGVDVPEGRLSELPISTSQFAQVLPDIISRRRGLTEEALVSEFLGPDVFGGGLAASRPAEGLTDLPTRAEPGRAVRPTGPRPSAVRRPRPRGRIETLTRAGGAAAPTGGTELAQLERQPEAPVEAFAEGRRPRGREAARRQRDVSALEREINRTVQVLSRVRDDDIQRGLRERLDILRDERQRLLEREEPSSRPARGSVFNRFAGELFPDRDPRELSGPETRAVNERVQEFERQQETAELERKEEFRKTDPIGRDLQRVFPGSKTVGDLERRGARPIDLRATDTKKVLREIGERRRNFENVVEETRQIENLIIERPEAVGPTGSLSATFNSLVSQGRNVLRLLPVVRESLGPFSGVARSVGITDQPPEIPKDVEIDSPSQLAPAEQALTERIKQNDEVLSAVEQAGLTAEQLSNRLMRLAFSIANTRTTGRVPVRFVDAALAELAPSGDPRASIQSLRTVRREAIERFKRESFAGLPFSLAGIFKNAEDVLRATRTPLNPTDPESPPILTPEEAREILQTEFFSNEDVNRANAKLEREANVQQRRRQLR